MPRTRRIIPDDLPLHIMVRGNNKQKIFQEDIDKKYYLYLLFKLKRYHGIDIYHYCLMDNHVHLVLLSRVPPLLSRFMMKVDLSYFFLFRNKYGYVGHLFQNRFKNNVIGHDEYLLQCGKYIELNPVRGGIVTKPEDYAFSSYRFYSQGCKDLLITPNPIYVALSEKEENRWKLYIDFVVDNILFASDKIVNCRYIGTDSFIRKMEQRYGLLNNRQPRGRPRKK